MYTKITSVIWATPEDQYAVGNDTFNNDRDSYINGKMFEDKTDGIGYVVSNVETRRLWIDQTAAQDWLDFITSLATEHNLNIVQTKIMDNAE